MQFRTWLETKFTPDVIQKIHNDIATNRYANVWMDNQGNILADYPDRPDSMSNNIYSKIYKSKISIYAEKKSVILKMIGDKLLPAQKKLIQFLLNNNIIDPTWNVDGGKEIGEYIGYNFTHFGDPDRPKTVNDISTLGVLSPAMEQITLYHGTSDYDWDKIQKAGALYPLFTGSNKEYGYESRFKHEHNKNLIYLSTQSDKAWDYGKARARSMNRKLFPDEWKWNKNHATEAWQIRPVLLRVIVPDITKLRADDDVINERGREIARKLWEQKSSEEQQRIMKELSKKQGFKVDDHSVAQMLWRDTDEGFTEILAKINPRIYRSWLASILKYDQVAYKGFIPLKFLKEIPIFQKRDEK